jgi:predicted nucleotidyltransferase
MTADADTLFQQLLRDAGADPDVLGLFLGGSRGKGFENELSDYDICVIVEDSAPEQARERYLRRNSEMFDVWLYSFSQFRDQAGAWDAEFWDRYSYARVTALIDKRDGEIQRLIDEKGSVPEERRVSWLRGRLDGYINSLYRSLKCMRKGNTRGARLEANDSIGYLLDVLFGYEGRHRPFYGYLERELRKYPLKSLPISTDDLLAKIGAIDDSADRATQQELLAAVDALLRPAGFGDVFDDWKEKYEWMKTFKG